MKKIIIISLALFSVALIETGCKKDWLDTVPSTSVTIPALKSIQGADLLITGTNRYRFVWNGLDASRHQYSCGEKSTDLSLDALAFDFTETGNGGYEQYWGVEMELHHNMDNAVFTNVGWQHAYKMIDNVNQLLSFVDEIQDGSDDEKAFYKAQALIYRAHYYHRLVQTYGKPYHTSPTSLGVPLVLTPSIEPTPRSSVEDVYAQIKADLKLAEALLTDNSVVRRDKTMADLSVVQGLLARVYSCTHQWDSVVYYANLARRSYPLMSKDEWRSGFSTVNNEWMWATIAPADEHQNAPNFFFFMSNGEGYPGAWGYDNGVGKQLYDHADLTDCRFYGTSIASGTPMAVDKLASDDHIIAYYKFFLAGMNSFAIPYMRGVEMLLLEAEGKAMQSDVGGAKELLRELLAARTDNADALISGIVDVVSEIKLQRRMEFWCEGFGYYDLKRWGDGIPAGGRGNGQLENYNGRAGTESIPADDPYFLFLIPKSELDANPLCIQNTY
jgi:hypothetical protein